LLLKVVTSNSLFPGGRREIVFDNKRVAHRDYLREMLVLANEMFNSPPVFAWVLPVFVPTRQGGNFFSASRSRIFVFSTPVVEVVCMVQASTRAVNGVFPPLSSLFWGKNTGGVILFCNNKRGALINNRPFH
jgi:hypothetical protein